MPSDNGIVIEIKYMDPELTTDPAKLRKLIVETLKPGLDQLFDLGLNCSALIFHAFAKIPIPGIKPGDPIGWIINVGPDDEIKIAPQVFTGNYDEPAADADKA